MGFVVAVAGTSVIVGEPLPYAAQARGEAERYARVNGVRTVVRDQAGKVLFLIEPNGQRLPPGGQTVCRKDQGYCACVPCREERRAKNA